MKATILTGDVLHRIKEIPDQTVQCVVTSPPYWGLRDYGHDGQLGLEPTPEAYVENMVRVFREVRRILKDDGVLWLNLGDSYVGYKGDNYLTNKESSKLQNKTTVPSAHSIGTPQTSGLKSKDLVGIPWRVAFALQTDGWWLRQDIIWHKPNPMPESVTDRCTKAHEYLFLLTKNARYSYNNDAIRDEPKLDRKTAIDQTPIKMNAKDIERMEMAKRIWGGNQMSKPRGAMYRGFAELKGANKKSVWTVANKGFQGAHFAVMPEALCEPPILATSQPDDLVFDPFTGSGTVATVALRHGRNYLGIELNPEYTQIAYNRIYNDQPMLNEIEIR